MEWIWIMIAIAIIVWVAVGVTKLVLLPKPSKSITLPLFAFKDGVEILETVRRLKKEWKEKKYFYIEEALAFCQEIIDGPWDKIKLERELRINPASVPRVSLMEGESIRGITRLVINQENGESRIEIVIAIGKGMEDDVERQIIVLLHEIGHIIHMSEGIENYTQSTSLKSETIAGAVSKFLTKLFIEVITNGPCPGIEQQRVEKLENAFGQVGGESERGLIVSLQLLQDALETTIKSDPSRSDLKVLKVCLETINKTMKMSNEEVQEVYDSVLKNYNK